MMIIINYFEGLYIDMYMYLYREIYAFVCICICIYMQMLPHTYMLMHRIMQMSILIDLEFAEWLVEPQIAWQAVFALLSPNSLNSACAMGITQARRLNFAYLFCSVGLSVGRQVDAL